MLQREREERLEGRMMFWGKVEGNENDYLVCYALATPRLEEGDFPIKKVFTAHDLTVIRQPTYVLKSKHNSVQLTSRRIRIES